MTDPIYPKLTGRCSYCDGLSLWVTSRDNAEYCPAHLCRAQLKAAQWQQEDATAAHNQRASMPHDLTLEEIATLAYDLGPDRYEQRVISLFASLRATQEQWQAMAEAIRRCSESAQGDLVACIDRAVLAAR